MMIIREGNTRTTLNGNWEQNIRNQFDSSVIESLFKPYRNDFLKSIWEMSMTAFSHPSEIQVVIDSKNDLFISVGSSSFVSFDDEESVEGMKLPIKCWIHTHPFGKAYFSETDRRTINTWQTFMLTAIVLGKNEHMLWMKNSPEMKFFKYSEKIWDNFTFDGEKE